MKNLTKKNTLSCVTITSGIIRNKFINKLFLQQQNKACSFIDQLMLPFPQMKIRLLLKHLSFSHLFKL